MKALVLDAQRKTAHIEDRPLPLPGHDGRGFALVRIKVCAIALNPVDALYVANPLGDTGRIVGSDFAGIVDATPERATSHVREGDRVAGFLQGACSINDRPGAFADYICCPVDLMWRVPDSLSLEAAAGVSLCGLTAAQALFRRLVLPAPFSWGCPAGKISSTNVTNDIGPCLFIYGASTSVGMYAAQLARRSAEASGIKIRLIGAANPSRSDKLRAPPYVYDELVDYRAAGWSEKVLELTAGNGVECAFDCISEGSTVRNVAKTLRTGGKMAIVRSREGGAWENDDLREGVEPSYGAVWEGLGEDVLYQGLTLPASHEERDFASAFYRWLSDGGELQPSPVRLMPGGLDRIVPDGFALLGSGSMEHRGKATAEWMRPVSAEKLVYKLQDG